MELKPLFALKEENILRVFEKKVVKGLFGLKGEKVTGK